MAQNTDEYLRSRGFTIYGHESGQVVRNCIGTSYHCQNLATAVDYGTGQYGVAGCWAIFNALAPLAYGPNRIVEELAFANRAIDGGRDVGAWPNHNDHTHTALVPGKLLPIAGGGGGSAADEGVDISEHQSTTPPAGFYYIRTISDGNREDYRWRQHHGAAAGHARGAYAIFDPGRGYGPEDWTNRFIATLRAAPWELVPTVDIELGDPNACRSFAAVAAQKLRAAGYPVVMGYYSRDSAYRKTCADLFDRQWIACYGCAYPAGAHMHQFTSSPYDKNYTPDLNALRAPFTLPKPKGSKMFAVHLVPAPEAGYPNGALFIGVPGAWWPVGLQAYAKALDEGHFQVTCNGAQWDQVNEQAQGNWEPIHFRGKPPVRVVEPYSIMEKLDRIAEDVAALKAAAPTT